MDDTKRQQIEWELTRIVNLFSHCMDKRRYDELAALFAEDGVFDRVGQMLNGRGEIRAAMDKRHPFLTRHGILNLVFTRVDENEAESTMYVANFIGLPETDGFPVGYAMETAFLEFDDLYRRTPEGWKIARRVARMIIKPAKADH